MRSGVLASAVRILGAGLAVQSSDGVHRLHAHYPHFQHLRQAELSFCAMVSLTVSL